MNNTVLPGTERYSSLEHNIQSLSAFVLDTQTKQQLELCLSHFDFDTLEICIGDVNSATKIYQNQSSPDLLIVDISNSELPLSDLQDLANFCSPDVRVLAIGVVNNVGLYRNLISHGVSDYLVKPLPSDLFIRVLKELEKPEEKPASPIKIGKSIGVFGVCGGIGCSSLVSTIADFLSTEQHRRVMLVDLNLHQGNLGILFGQAPNQGLSELLGSPERIDEFFIKRVAVSIGPRLELLNTDENWENEIEVSRATVVELTEHLRQRYHFVIYDVMSNPLYKSVHILRSMDTHIIVLSPTLSALRNTKKILDQIGQGNPDAQTFIVLNHSRPPQKSIMPVNKVEQFIGRAIDFEIPYDGKSFSTSELLAIPGFRRRGKAAQYMREIAESLVGQGKRATHRPFWKHLTGRGHNVW